MYFGQYALDSEDNFETRKEGGGVNVGNFLRPDGSKHVLLIYI